MVDRRPGPRRIPRLARRLRLHQGPRRAGPGREREATCPSASCDRRSSSRPWPNPSRAGSAASAWPSRSSSPTPAACWTSSPACPRASSTSSPSTSWSAAIIAVAAKGPEPGPEVVQVASGSANPLRYRRLVDLVSEWFTEHPLYDTEGQPIVVPKWSFPGRGQRAGPAPAGPQETSNGPRTSSDRSRCGASRPSGPPPSRPSVRRPNGPSGTWSSTAPTPSARPSTGRPTPRPVGRAEP